MKPCLLAFLATLMLAPRAQAQTPVPANCGPASGLRFVCGQSGPEDLVAVPGSAWLVASGYGPEGGVNLIDTKASSSRRLFPDPAVAERLDRATYDSCPGPIPATDRKRFWTHGLYLKAGQNRIHTLYVVHHGSREAIEVFEFDARNQQPALTWIGHATYLVSLGGLYYEPLWVFYRGAPIDDLVLR